MFKKYHHKYNKLNYSRRVVACRIQKKRVIKAIINITNDQYNFRKYHLKEIHSQKYKLNYLFKYVRFKK